MLYSGFQSRKCPNFAYASDLGLPYMISGNGSEIKHIASNRPFAANHSRDTKPPCWRAKSHWDKTNEGNYHLKLCMPFVGLVPVQLFLSSVAVFYHMNGQLHRAYSCRVREVEKPSNHKSLLLISSIFSCNKYSL